MFKFCKKPLSALRADRGLATFCPSDQITKPEHFRQHPVPKDKIMNPGSHPQFMLDGGALLCQKCIKFPTAGQQRILIAAHLEQAGSGAAARFQIPCQFTQAVCRGLIRCVISEDLLEVIVNLRYLASPLSACPRRLVFPIRMTEESPTTVPYCSGWLSAARSAPYPPMDMPAIIVSSR